MLKWLKKKETDNEKILKELKHNIDSYIILFKDEYLLGRVQGNKIIIINNDIILFKDINEYEIIETGKIPINHFLFYPDFYYNLLNKVEKLNNSIKRKDKIKKLLNEE